MLRNLGLLICLTIALILSYFGYKELSVDRSNLYEAVSAEITTVSMTDRIVQSTSSVSNVTIVNRSTRYNLTANYKYTVNNTVYTGSYPMGEYSSLSLAQNQVNNIMNNPNNKKITVYYEKSKPQKSVLNVVKNNSWSYFIGAIVFVIFGLLVKFVEFIPIPQSNYGNQKVIIFNN